jgi:dihydroorotase
MTLVKESWSVPASVPFGPDTLVPLRAGAAVDWKIAGT